MGQGTTVAILAALGLGAWWLLGRKDTSSASQDYVASGGYGGDTPNSGVVAPPVPPPGSANPDHAIGNGSYKPGEPVLSPEVAAALDWQTYARQTIPSYQSPATPSLPALVVPRTATGQKVQLPSPSPLAVGATPTAGGYGTGPGVAKPSPILAGIAIPGTASAPYNPNAGLILQPVPAPKPVPAPAPVKHWWDYLLPGF